MGLFLYGADKRSTKSIELRNISFGQSILIGVSQVLAIIPGVSRSGVTMTTGLLAGMTREGAARFSFLLSTPIIFGAAMVKLPHVLSHSSMITTNFMIGMLVSCISGLLCIGFLLRYVQRRSFLPFVLYRFALGLLVVVVVLAR
jgi:undecaprenyl-diphosphatase